jgi:polyphosphate:AMP phosphotransferase
MFESAEIGHTIDKKRFAREVPKLRSRLLDAQYELLEKRAFPVIVVIGGVDGAGKGETVNILNEWMDPRHIQTHALAPPTEEERAHPRYWRFWRNLPPKGKMGIFLGAWHTDPILLRVHGEIDDEDLEVATKEINAFERMLVDDGALLVKFWFHLSKDRQRKRLRSLEKDPLTRWRVTDTDWKHFKLYDKFRKVSESVLRETSTGEAPWVVIEGTDHRYRSLTAGTVLVDLLEKRLEVGPRHPRKAIVPPQLPAMDSKLVLGTIDLNKKIGKDVYEKKLEKLSGKLNALSREPKFQKRALVVVFEGMDAAGKGGAIRRITRALDARSYDVIPTAAPTEEERAQPYLWRFWRHVPMTRGRIAIFDRSWYGRVLVERVEGYAKEEEWLRAYSEINDFEEQLVESKITIVKFWMHISKDEQLARFRERERTSFKQFKITKEDWRNRKRWDDYILAACDMIDRTSTDIAPWTIVAANDKYHARIEVMRTLVRALEKVL